MIRTTLKRYAALWLAPFVAFVALSAVPQHAGPAAPQELGATALVADGKPQTRKQRNKAIARPLVSKRGWSKRQFRCLSKLWTRESNWNHKARNSSSGAYGIPQALPGSKMAVVAKDWRTNPRTQIKWGLRYIKSRYGTPCKAWNHSQARGWY